MAVKIVIDAGHGGYDNGASYNGRKEKDDTLKLALKVGEILEQMGYDVVYTRTTDVYDSPVQKAQIANALNGDFFVSVHRNSSPTDPPASGTSGWLSALRASPSPVPPPTSLAALPSHRSPLS